MKEMTDRQREVVEAALALVSERGLEAMTIKNIAARVGFSDAAVYRHFSSKARILEAIIDQFAAGSAQLLAGIESCECPSLEKIRLFFLDRCRVFSGDRVLATVMFAEHLFEDDPALSAKFHLVLQGHRRRLMAILREGQRRRHIRPLPAQHLFTMIMGSLRLLVMQWRAGGCAFDLMRAGEKLWRSLESAISAPQGE